MGLDISIRYRRINAEPLGYDTYSRPYYLSKDCVDSDYYFNGRYEFNCVKEWVGEDRYGQYIPLTIANYKELLDTIAESIEEHHSENNEYRADECPTWLEYSGYGLTKLFNLILRAPEFEKRGWYMELECDW